MKFGQFLWILSINFKIYDIAIFIRGFYEIFIKPICLFNSFKLPKGNFWNITNPYKLLMSQYIRGWFFIFIIIFCAFIISFHTPTYDFPYSMTYSTTDISLPLITYQYQLIDLILLWPFLKLLATLMLVQKKIS